MKRLLLLLSLSVTSFLNAQNEPDLMFANKENNVGYGGAITTTNSAKDGFGNTYLVGTFSNVADFDPTAAEANLTAVSNSDLFIAVYDTNGLYLGARNIGGTGAITRTSIAIDGSFIYLSGTYTNTIDFDPSAAVANLTTTNTTGAGFLAKYDLNGNLITCKSIDGPGTIRINDVKFFNNQLTIIGGLTGTMDFDPSATTFNLTQAGTVTGAFIVKYDNALLVLSAVNLSSNGNINASSLAIDNGGNMIITGTYTGTADFDPSPAPGTLVSGANIKTFVAKYTDAYVFQWVKDIGGNTTTAFSNNPKLVLDTASNIVVTGIFSMTADFDPSTGVASLTTNGSSDVFIAKYDAAGTFVWVKRVGGTTADQVANMALDTTNSIYISGTFTGIANFNPNVGPNVNLDATTGNNFFAKYDSNGNVVYANNLNATISSILVNTGDALMVSGTFVGTRDFDTSAATANLVSFNTSAFLAKYTASNSYVFAKPIGGDKATNRIISYIANDASGAIYRAGQLSATTDLDPSVAVFNLSSASGLGMFLAKYSASGSFLWGKKIEGGTGTTVGVSVMNTDVNGNTFIVGGFLGTVDFDPSAGTANMTSTSTTFSDLFIAKYDTNGNYLWVKQITGAGAIGARKKIVFDTSGNFYFSGSFNGNNPIDVDPSPTSVFNLVPNGMTNAYFIKFSPQGDFIWAKSINAATTTGNFISITQFDIKDNNLYMTGRFFGTADMDPSATVNAISTIIPQSNETFFAKYDLNGDYQFAIKFDNDPAGLINKGSSFTVDSNGDIYLLSIFIYSVDFDPSPTATTILTAVPDVTSFNLAILKYTSTGSFVWAKQIQPADIDSFFPTASTLGNEWLSSSYIKNNELIITSAVNGNFDFDPSAGSLLINSTMSPIGQYYSSMFVAKYNKSTGDVISAKKLEGNYNAEIYNTVMDNQNLLMAGSFLGTVDFDFTAAAQNLTSASAYNYDRFWAKYEDSTLGLEEHSIAKGCIVYPNPTNSVLYVLNPFNDEFEVTILDITGKVLQKEVLTNQKGIDVSTYSQGMYFIQIENALEKTTLKFSKK